LYAPWLLLSSFAQAFQWIETVCRFFVVVQVVCLIQGLPFCWFDLLCAESGFSVLVNNYAFEWVYI